MFPSKLPIISQPPSDQNNDFVSTWTTTGTDEKVTLPFVQNNAAGSANTLNFTIDWGDNESDTVTAYNDNLGGGAIDHTYSSASTYIVTMTGTIQGFKFAAGGDRLKLSTITNWGLFNMTNDNAFNGCTNLTISATDAPTVSSTNLSNAFKNCTAITSIGADWDVGSVTNMSSAFNGCTNFNSDIDDWNVSSVQTWTEAFRSCANFNRDISSWNMAATTGTFRMFQSCTAFNQDIGSWNMSSNTYMREMFKAAGSFDQDISSWDVNQVTDFTSFLQNSNALSTANYNLLLHHWEADDPLDSKAFHGGDATTDTTSGGVDGTAARQRLVDNHSWTITDGD